MISDSRTFISDQVERRKDQGVSSITTVSSTVP
jgi:hypothetical protein